MGTTTTWLVIVFDASGYPSQIEQVSRCKADADAMAKEFRENGCEWVKVMTVTSPVVPYGIIVR